MRPIETSPDRWHAHPFTIGYGVAVGLGIVGALLLGVAIARLVGRIRESRRTLRRDAGR